MPVVAAEFDGTRTGEQSRPDAMGEAPSGAEPGTRGRQALLVASHASPSAPTTVSFNSRLLMGGGIDLSRFERGNPVVAGIYPVDVTVNGERRGRMDVEFRDVRGGDSAAPCFTRAMLDRLGVEGDIVAKRLDAARDATGAASGQTPTLSASACIGLRDALPDATYTLDSADLTLDLTIPQVDMRKTARGYVDPSRWDNGVNAGLLQYNLSGYASENKFFGNHASSLFLGLQAGANIGAWRVRQRSNLMWANRSAGMSWRSLETYVQRDITALRSQITLGDSYTTGEIFESFGVRGMQLASDDRMLPVSLQSYAPTVRGVADTNARVAVRQRGNVIYEASVPPGPFEFDDLPPTGYGGDLDVTITESDGRTKHFTVPFASVRQLLRPGMQRFNFTVGQYRDALSNGKPWVAQLTYQRGMTNLLTGYAGLLSSTGYASGLIGVALNTPIGAFAFDVTSARTHLPG
ncbi:fimbria/pilus outer membrane usher protein, partial [Burkholderia pseudomallei]